MDNKKQAIGWLILMITFGICCFILGVLMSGPKDKEFEINMHPPCGNSFKSYSMEYYQDGRLKSWKCES